LAFSLDLVRVAMAEDVSCSKLCAINTSLDDARWVQVEFYFFLLLLLGEESSYGVIDET